MTKPQIFFLSLLNIHQRIFLQADQELALEMYDTVSSDAALFIATATICYECIHSNDQLQQLIVDCQYL